MVKIYCECSSALFVVFFFLCFQPKSHKHAVFFRLRFVCHTYIQSCICRKPYFLWNNSPLIISEFLPRRTPEKEDRDKQEVLHRGDTVSTQLSILHQNFKSSNRDHYRVTKGSENMCRITLCVQ